MGELGQLLRQAREEKGISLEEIEKATRIRQRYLVALEAGDYGQLPTPGHIQGFLRNYAVHIGLDWNEVQGLYAKEASSHHISDPGIFHPKDIILAPRKPLLKADLVLALVILLVAGVIGGWAFWRYGRPLLFARSMPTSTPEPATTEPVAVKSSATATHAALSATPTPVVATPTPQKPTATSTLLVPTPTKTLDAPLLIATPTLPPTSTPIPTPKQTEGVVLQVKVVERTWLQVTVDNQELPGELLEADQERKWEAKQAIHLICGNAGGVVITVNGVELGSLGERGQVVEKTWTPQGEATPTPTPLVAGTPGTTTVTPSPAAGGIQATSTATPTTAGATATVTPSVTPTR
jgi:cytoskeletal protein RodZ